MLHGTHTFSMEYKAEDKNTKSQFAGYKLNRFEKIYDFLKRKLCFTDEATFLTYTSVKTT